MSVSLKVARRRMAQGHTYFSENNVHDIDHILGQLGIKVGVDYWWNRPTGDFDDWEMQAPDDIVLEEVREFLTGKYDMDYTSDTTAVFSLHTPNPEFADMPDIEAPL